MLNETSDVATTRAQRRAEQRGRILSIALAEFVQHGFNGASTRTITKKAGVSSGLLFHYFPSKEAVFEELVNIGCAHLEVDLAQACADPIGFLCEKAEESINMLREAPTNALFFLFIDYAQRNPGISAKADEMLNKHNVIDQSVPVFEAGQASGVIRAGDPLALSLAFWSVLQGVAEEIAVRPELPLPDAEWILAMVQPAPSGGAK